MNIYRLTEEEPDEDEQQQGADPHHPDGVTRCCRTEFQQSKQDHHDQGPDPGNHQVHWDDWCCWTLMHVHCTCSQTFFMNVFRFVLVFLEESVMN